MIPCIGTIPTPAPTKGKKRADARNRAPAVTSNGVRVAVSGMPNGKPCPSKKNARSPVFLNREAVTST